MSASFGVWLAGFVTIATMSYVYKENPFFRLAEHIYVGISAGHAVVMGYGNIRDMAWKPMTTKGQLVWIIPIVLGILLYARYIKGVSWISRIPMSVILGLGLGVAMRGAIDGDFVKQILATLKIKDLNGCLLLLGVVTSLSYFFFSKEIKGPAKAVPQIGRYVMMVAFGAAFGNTVMGRMALLIGRVQFILGDWWGIIR